MPCSDAGPSYGDYQQEKLDKATRVACATIQAYAAGIPYGQFMKLHDEARIWWATHQENDRKREAKEARQREKETAKRAALAKLTKEERALLRIWEPSE